MKIEKDIIASISASLIGQTVILVIMSVSTFKTIVILLESEHFSLKEKFEDTSISFNMRNTGGLNVKMIQPTISLEMSVPSQGN